MKVSFFESIARKFGFRVMRRPMTRQRKLRMESLEVRALLSATSEIVGIPTEVVVGPEKLEQVAQPIVEEELIDLLATDQQQVAKAAAGTGLTVNELQAQIDALMAQLNEKLNVGSEFKACEVPSHDPNGDGLVNAGDVLFVINQLNAHEGAGFRLNVLAGQIWDTNADGWLTPLDALNIIADLNRNGPHSAVGNCTVNAVVDRIVLGDIEVAPGQTVLVASVNVTALDEILFLSSVSPIGTSEQFQLTVNGNTIGTTGQGGSFTFVTGTEIVPARIAERFDIVAKAPMTEGWYQYGFGTFNLQAMPGANVAVVQPAKTGRLVHVVNPVYPKPTVVTAQGFGPGISDLGSINWGRELGGDVFGVQISVVGPNIDGDLPVFLPVESMTVKSAEGKFVDDTPVAWWNGDTLVENFTFNVLHNVGDVDYLFGQVDFRQELLDAVFWLTLFDQDGNVLAVSDKAPVGVL